MTLGRNPRKNTLPSGHCPNWGGAPLPKFQIDFDSFSKVLNCWAMFGQSVIVLQIYDSRSVCTKLIVNSILFLLSLEIVLYTLPPLPSQRRNPPPSPPILILSLPEPQYSAILAPGGFQDSGGIILFSTFIMSIENFILSLSSYSCAQKVPHNIKQLELQFLLLLKS